MPRLAKGRAADAVKSTTESVTDRYRHAMARIGPVELLILVLIMAAVVGVVLLVGLGVRSGSRPVEPSTALGGRWVADPTRRHQLRWWDGQAWSPSVSDNGVLGHDPME
jgi:hypothetical protein